MDTTPQPKTSAIVRLRLRTLLLELLVLAVIAVLLLFGLFQAYHYTTRYSVDLTVKEPDTRLEWVGFHIPEANDEFRFRWSRPYAFFQLRNASPFAAGYLATLRLRIPTPDPNRRLTFLLNERPVAEVVPTAAFRVYQLALPAPTNEPNLRLALALPELRLPNDVRPLGVVMTSAALTPVREANLLVIAGIILGIGVVGLGWHAPILCAALGTALVALIAFANPMPLGVAWLAGFAIVGACIAVLSTKDMWAQVGLAVLCALVAFSGSLRMSWLTDDAFISFRYAQNLAHGHGLVYNIGERVEGYTNFLWTILAALVLWLGGDIVWWSYLSGIVLALAILLLTFALAQRLIGTHWALLAALIVATSQSLLIHTARGAGLETGLFTLLVLAGVGLVMQNLNNDPVSRVATAPIPIGLLFALATLTRPEGLFFFGLVILLLAFASLGIDFRKTGWFTNLRAGVLPKIYALLPAMLAYLVVVVPFFLWRLSYYGDLLPNTFYAKTGGGPQTWLRGLEYTAGFALALGGPLLLFVLVPLRTKPLFNWHAFLLIMCGLYTLYVIAVGGDHFPGERFFVVLVPLLALLVAHGVQQCSRWLRQTALRPVVPLVLLALVAGYGFYAQTRAAEQDVIMGGSDENLGIWREMGWWLAENGNPDASIAAMSAGALAFYSEHATIDMLGLTDRHIARVSVVNAGAGPAGHEKRDPSYVLNERKPTYIPQMWQDYFGGPEVLRGTYELITITTRYGREIGMWRRL